MNNWCCRRRCRSCSLSVKKNRYLLRCISPVQARQQLEDFHVYYCSGDRLALLGFYIAFRQLCSFLPPKTATTEWQKAENQRAWEMNINPIFGVSSPDYKGKSFKDWGHTLL
ncbi:hypothetical protein M378DRAFT_26179 [Amanita muscaria Koide BX008]|uniref:Uncharacterized protein n=1 Tax=Amanita muscaria (strain Koide BX008) TaxID=946122 RepID=A0A0C2WXR9_AMAMK|nr:hypothetical protein M378DRAFT_26179 [Amanita muscaria Koide BX008]